MSNDKVLMTAGEVAGVARRMSLEEVCRAAKTRGLTPRNRALMEAVVRFCRELDEVMKLPGVLEGT